MRSRVLGNILRIGRCCKLYRKRALKDTELLPAQHLLLSYICRCPGLAQEGLAGTLFLDKTTVAHQLIRLEEQGFIRRQPSAEDGRCRLLYPTEKGEAIYPLIHGTFEEFTAGLLEGFTEEERRNLEALTERLFQNARRLLEEGAAEP
jgi:DNA-binding MarR family transcriptional regulator